jgi:hypothetical protein
VKRFDDLAKALEANLACRMISDPQNYKNRPFLLLSSRRPAMKFTQNDFLRAVKRVQESLGYMELALPQQARQTLAEIKNLGPFEAQVELIRGEALRMEERYADAGQKLATAAHLMPGEWKTPALVALTNVLKQTGDPAQIAQTFGIVRGAKPSPLFNRFGDSQNPDFEDAP